MKHQINRVVAEYIKLVEMIVQGQWKIEDKTARQEIPDALQIWKGPYSRIVNDIKRIIEMKRAAEAIGIDNNP